MQNENIDGWNYLDIVALAFILVDRGCTTVHISFSDDAGINDISYDSRVFTIIPTKEKEALEVYFGPLVDDLGLGKYYDYFNGRIVWDLDTFECTVGVDRYYTKSDYEEKTHKLIKDG